MIYVYAIVDWSEAPLPRQLGLQDAELAKVIWRDVAAVVSPFNGTVTRAANELWRHEEVVESLMGDRAVLPARFGTLLRSHQHVSDMLCQSYNGLAEDIERVRGYVEIGMRFLTTAEDDTAAEPAPSVSAGLAQTAMGPGSAYLWSRLAKERDLQRRRHAKLSLIREAFDALATHAHASRLEDAQEDRPGTSAAFLVPRDRLLSFRAIATDVANAHPQLAMLCTGPWPPYSFVNAGKRATDWSE
jgi:hypothetical protein